MTLKPIIPVLLYGRSVYSLPHLMLETLHIYTVQLRSVSSMSRKRKLHTGLEVLKQILLETSGCWL